MGNVSVVEEMAGFFLLLIYNLLMYWYAVQFEHLICVYCLQVM